MTADNPYLKSEIGTIPIHNLKEIIADEMTSLLFDFGQKVGLNDPEFDYLVNRTADVLRNHYAKWKLHYLDECFRHGKLDDYDKGQKVTMKRLEYWFKSYNISLYDRRKNQFNDREYSESDNQRFVENSTRFGRIMKFRQMRKPDFDGEQWTLVKIESSPEYQLWLQKGGYRSNHQMENLVYKKVSDP